MKRVIFITATMALLLSANPAGAGISELINGSFEDDGPIYPVSLENAPNGWSDVNVPADKFCGWVDQDWPTHGSRYNLTLYSYGSETFEMNDIATVSQWVNLADVNVISFDLRLDTDDEAWNPNTRSAIVLIDDIEVWNSDWNEPDANGEYHYETVDVSGKYDDRGQHKLSLGIKVDVNEPNPPRITYYTDWDSVGFDLHCGGNGFLAGDFSRDCCVDTNDLQILAEKWLDEVDTNSKYNLFWSDEAVTYGIINFLDFAIFADGWDGNMGELGMFTDIWLDEVAANNEYNLFHGDDIGPMAIINFLDFAIFAGGWDGNMGELEMFTEIWLDEVDANNEYNLFHGDDIEPSAIINFLDFTILADNWLQCSDE